MQLLRELLQLATSRADSTEDCFTLETTMADKYAAESVDNIVDVGPDYVPMVKKKAKKRRFPTSDRAENNLINTQWFYNNSDAS